MLIHRGLPCWLYLLMLCIPVAAEAQSPSVEVGERVRFSGPIGFRWEGVVTAATADSLTIFSGRDGLPPVQFSWGSLADVEVRRGLSRARGALRGGKRGAMIGGALGLLVISTVFTEEDDFGPADFMVAITVEGAVIGAIVGGIAPGSAWNPLPR